MDDKQFTYLLEAYKIAVDYLSGYVDRIYTRFNIFLGVDIALAGIYAGVLFNSKSITNAGKVLVLSLGLIISLLLYIQSAQDRYALKAHRVRINRMRALIEKQIGRDDIPALFSPLDDERKKLVVEGLTSWRSDFISTSRLPVLTSIFLVIFWIITFFL